MLIDCLATDALCHPSHGLQPSIALQLMAALLAADPGTDFAQQVYAADVPGHIVRWLSSKADAALLAPLPAAQVN